MKTIFYILASVAIGLAALLSGVMLSHAGEVTLEWDPNNETVDGYRLFWRIDGTQYDYERSVLPDNFPATTFTVKNLIPGVKYCFVVRAYLGDNESGDSNEVEYYVPPQLYICRGCLLTATGERPAAIWQGTFLVDGYPDLLAYIRPVPEDNDNPPYSRNATWTIYHKTGCRYYDPDRGLSDPSQCPTCRACKVCGGK